MSWYVHVRHKTLCSVRETIKQMKQKSSTLLTQRRWFPLISVESFSGWWKIYQVEIMSIGKRYKSSRTRNHFYSPTLFLLRTLSIIVFAYPRNPFVNLLQKAPQWMKDRRNQRQRNRRKNAWENFFASARKKLVKC